MAIERIGTATAVETNSEDKFVLTLPSGIQVNDLIVCVASGYWLADGIDTPAGWTTVVNNVDFGGGIDSYAWMAYRFVEADESATLTLDTNTSEENHYGAASLVAYRNVDTTGPVQASGSATGTDKVAIAPTVSPAASGLLVSLFATIDVAAGTSPDLSTPSGMSMRAERHRRQSYVRSVAIADETVTSGVTGTRTSTLSGTSTDTSNDGWYAANLVLAEGIQVPYAPSLVAPVGSATIDRSVNFALTWAYSAPTGVAQGDAILRYRLENVPTWTTSAALGAVSSNTVIGGALAAGNWEWQVKTANADGGYGPWSSSGFFTAADPPSLPVWVDPVDLDTVVVPTLTAELTNAGTPELLDIRIVSTDGATEHSYTSQGWTGSPIITFPPEVNNETVDLEARVKDNGLWSDWASIEITVDYPTPPAVVPTLTLSADKQTIVWTDVAPTGDEVEIDYVLIYGREQNPRTEEWGEVYGGTVQRADSGTLDQYTGSNVNTDYRLVSVGVNGAQLVGGWISVDLYPDLYT